jgi:hypothetical protein
MWGVVNTFVTGKGATQAIQSKFIFLQYFSCKNSFQDSLVQSWKKWKQQKRILHVNLGHQWIAV